jgi:Gas vesicle protein K
MKHRKRPTARSPRTRVGAGVKRQSPQRGRRSGSRRRREARAATVPGLEVQEIDSLRNELERVSKGAPPRWNANPDEVRRSVAKLVLTLVEFIRQLLERQAIRRMDAGTLTAEETEAVGLALMRLEETVRDLAAQFGLSAEDLNLDLGPVGRLM